MASFTNPSGYRDPTKLESRIDFYQEYGRRKSKHDWYSWVADNISLSNSDQVLEVGCGSGNLWQQGEWEVNPAEEVIISDISDVMVYKSHEKLHSEFPEFQFACLDVHDIPFDDEVFDVVIANHVLHLVENLEESINEISRVLKSDGTLYSTTKYQHNFRGIDNILQNFGINKNINDIDQFEVNEAGRKLSHLFSSVHERLFKEVYNIGKEDVDALVSFADSKLDLDRHTKKHLKRTLLNQIDQRQGVDEDEYSIGMEKYNGLIIAQK